MRFKDSERAVVSSRVDRRSMKYKARITTEITNAAANTNFVISADSNARTPTPRNPMVSTTIEDTKVRHKRLLDSLPFISDPFLLDSEDSRPRCAIWWLASSSSRADSAKRGRAISFVTLASVARATSFSDFLFLAITHHVILHEAIQSSLEHHSTRGRVGLSSLSSVLEARRSPPNYSTGLFPGAANASNCLSPSSEPLCSEPNLRWAVSKWSRSSRSEL